MAVHDGNAELIRAETTAIESAATWAPALIRTVDQAVEQVNMRRDFMKRVMREGHDYGEMPGVKGGKPVLFKPGAENLLANMGLHPEFVTDGAVEDWTGRDHGGEPFLGYTITCRIYRQTGMREDERMLVASAAGSCNSWETKYRYRQQKRRCPKCLVEAILESKNSPGFYCWAKQGGCGAQFAADDTAITDQKIGRAKNPDVADVANTILKMAAKRSLVAATLLATGFSDLLTQDVGDDREYDAETGELLPPAPTQRPAAQRASRSRAKAAPAPSGGDPGEPWEAAPAAQGGPEWPEAQAVGRSLAAAGLLDSFYEIAGLKGTGLRHDDWTKLTEDARRALLTTARGLLEGA